MTAETVALIKLGMDIAAAAAQGVAQARAAKDAVERMVAENRDPTDLEWLELNAVRDELHKAIQGA